MKKLLVLLAALSLCAQTDAVVRIGDLFYELNNKKHTASVVCPYDYDEELREEIQMAYLDTLLIPATIKHQGKKYRVTDVFEQALSHLIVKVVVLPKSVINIEEDAFAFVPTVIYPRVAYKFAHGVAYYPVETGYVLHDVDEYYIEELTPWWRSTTINCYVDSPFIYLDACKQDLVGCMIGVRGVLVIPDSVVNIGQGAFWNCSRVTSVVVPDNVGYVSQDALWQLPNVEYSGELEGAPWGARALNGQPVSR